MLENCKGNVTSYKALKPALVKLLHTSLNNTDSKTLLKNKSDIERLLAKCNRNSRACIPVADVKPVLKACLNDPQRLSTLYSLVKHMITDIDNHPNKLVFVSPMKLFISILMNYSHLANNQIMDVTRNQMDGYMLGFHSPRIYTVSSYLEELSGQQLVDYSDIKNYAQSINKHSVTINKTLKSLFNQYTHLIIDNASKKYHQISKLYQASRPSSLWRIIKCRFRHEHLVKTVSYDDVAKAGKTVKFFKSTITHLKSHLNDSDRGLRNSAIWNAEQMLSNYKNSSNDFRNLFKVLDAIVVVPHVNLALLPHAPCFQSDLSCARLMHYADHGDYLTNPRLIYDYKHLTYLKADAE